MILMGYKAKSEDPGGYLFLKYLCKIERRNYDQSVGNLFQGIDERRAIKTIIQILPETREETTHPAGLIPASLRFESDTFSFKAGEQRRHE